MSDIIYRFSLWKPLAMATAWFIVGPLVVVGALMLGVQLFPNVPSGWVPYFVFIPLGLVLFKSIHWVVRATFASGRGLSGRQSIRITSERIEYETAFGAQYSAPLDEITRVELMMIGPFRFGLRVEVGSEKILIRDPLNANLRLVGTAIARAAQCSLRNGKLIRIVRAPKDRTLVLRCRSCHYELTGLYTARCPECGHWN